MQKNKIKLLTILLGVISLIVIVYSQRFPIYVDLSSSHSIAPSSSLKEKFNDISTDINVTIFASNELISELDINLLKKWLLALSPNINVIIYDPIKSPDKADHYDINNDGIIVIENKNNRFDIDIIEQVIINEGHHIEYLQNIVLRKLFAMIQKKVSNVLFVHSNHESLINNSGHIGLIQFKEIFQKNFISIDEMSTHSLETIDKEYDLIIIYKLAGIDANEKQQIKYFLSLNKPVIIFNHPKLSANINQFLSSDIRFSSNIIEDSTSHLIQSQNQLIINYLSSLENQLIGVFPYSSYVDVGQIKQSKLTGTSSETSFIEIESNRLKGPFKIIHFDQDNKLMLINNYLIPTNYWINFGDNILIIEDIIFSLLDEFTYISTRDTSNDFIIFSYINLMKLFLILIVLPTLAYLLFRYYYIYSSDSY